ncbi:MAG: O-antigen ligase family protein, partial [Anaerolineae bacterium]|nr:O-antigen ligase family protein [Anaerolineae bacterium]
WLSPSRRLAWGLRLALFTGLAGVVAAGLWLGEDGLQRMLDEPGQMQALGGLSTVGFRVEVWRWALVAISDFAFTGCGLGAFREVGRLLYPLAIAPTYDYAHAHNIFLQVALDTGIPGLVAYLALLGISLGILWRAAWADPDLRSLAVGLLGGLAALHIYGLTDALAPGAKPGLVFWTILGLVGVIGSGVATRRCGTECAGQAHARAGEGGEVT